MTPRTQRDDIEVDIASFVVRSQKFRIAAMIMKRTSVPLATEYATRLVHLVQGIRLEDLLRFFDFEAAESRVLLQDVLGTGLVVERNGQLFLSAQGHEALSPMTDRLDLFEVEEIATTIALDLAAFTFVEEATLNPRETRLVQELKLPDREKAATAIASARDAFDLHFQEWRLTQGRRRGLDEDTRLHSIEDVQVVGAIPSVVQVPIRWRSGDMPGVEPDFSELSSKGRAGSRAPLISTLSTRLKSFVAPADHRLSRSTGQFSQSVPSIVYWRGPGLPVCGWWDLLLLRAVARLSSTGRRVWGVRQPPLERLYSGYHQISRVGDAAFRSRTWQARCRPRTLPMTAPFCLQERAEMQATKNSGINFTARQANSTRCLIAAWRCRNRICLMRSKL